LTVFFSHAIDFANKDFVTTIVANYILKAFSLKKLIAKKWHKIKKENEKMKTKKQILTIAISVILTLSIAAMMPISKAQTGNTLPTNAFLAVSPSPAGIGQQVTLEMWLVQANPTSSGPTGGRWQGFTVHVTTPSGTTSTLGPFTANDAAFAVTTYTPESTGNYTFLFTFPGQHVTGINTETFAPVNSYYTSSNYTATLVVQQQPASSYSSPALPTAYWTRPINAQNSAWASISGNWLAQGGGFFGTAEYNDTGNFNPYTEGPNTAHILWSKPLMAGGLIGGEFGGTDTSNYFTGKSYQPALTPSIIINGILYYNSPLNPRYGFYAVNLRTGQTLYYQNSTGPAYLGLGGLVEGWNFPGITTGQVYNPQTPNQIGAFPYLWSTSTSSWYMYDANTGNLILEIANATTGGVTAEGPSGELLEYYIGNGWVAMWNSSLCIGTLADYTPPIPLFATNQWVWSTPDGAVLNWANGVQWNVTVQTAPGAAISTVNSGVILTTNLVLLGGIQSYATEAGYSSSTGNLLWIQNVTLPSGPTNGYGYQLGPMVNGIFTAYDEYAETWYAYNAYTGAKIWGPSAPDPAPWGSQVILNSGEGQIAYGILYAETPGDVRALNLTTGKVLWTFNGINSGTNFPGFSYYPFESEPITIADGKLYLQSGDSHGDPLFSGAQLYCVNATTGALIWNINDFGPALSFAPISDGVLVALNGYDNQIYAYGMGPSKTTVSAPQVGITTSTPVTITGSVTDISAGTSQIAVAANFPNGLPCVSDASMTQFMEGVYMQQSMPSNITGVPVTLYVLDSNNNYRSIGTTTSNAQGEFGLTWTPDISGNYTIYAVFAGTNGYYGSSASTYIYASSPAPTAAPTATPLSGLASNTTVMYAVVAMIIVFIVGIAIVAVLVTRKHP
jgi:hypothetical protein